MMVAYAAAESGHVTDEIIGSRQPTGWIDRIIKVVADRNVNRVTILSRAVIVRGNINQDLVNINATDLLVSVAGMLWKNCENSGFFEFLYMAGQGTVGNPQTGSQFIHIHFLMLKESLDRAVCVQILLRLFPLQDHL